MAKGMATVVLAATIIVFVLQSPASASRDTDRDVGVGIALEWTDLHDRLLCSDARQVAGAGLELVGVVAGRIHSARLHLAQ